MAVHESVITALGRRPVTSANAEERTGVGEVRAEYGRKFGSAPPCWPDSSARWPVGMPRVGVCNGGGLSHYCDWGAVVWVGSESSTSRGRPHIGYERSAACECNPGSASDAAGAASCADCETVCAAMGFADWTAPGSV